MYCPGFVAVHPNAPNTSLPFGIATWSHSEPNSTSGLNIGDLRVTELSGYCVGQTGAGHLAYIKNKSTQTFVMDL